MRTPKQIFEGIRILDFTQWLAGPQATRLMVDLGAEVIKIELPPRGEHSRNIRIVPKDGKDGTLPTYFTMHNRGKKSLCVDVKTPEGQAVIKDLVKVCDVVFENFTPGIMAHYGLTYGVLSQINPSMVMCSVSTYSDFHFRATRGRGRPARRKSDRDGRAPRKKGRIHSQTAISLRRVRYAHR
ncbi:MAG: CoA transferase [Deltaproteobacteria bacterium]|nr:CoA transferase [Deltaproteobacteria bacterium]